MTRFRRIQSPSLSLWSFLPACLVFLFATNSTFALPSEALKDHGSSFSKEARDLDNELIRRNAFPPKEPRDDPSSAPWPDLPPLNYTRVTPPLPTNQSGEIIIPNCTHVDCSSAVQCPTQQDTSNDTFIASQKRSVKERQINPGDEGIIRCNSAYYEPRFVVRFLATQHVWFVRWSFQIANSLTRFSILLHSSIPGRFPNEQGAVHDMLPPGQYWQVGYIFPPEILQQFAAFHYDQLQEWQRQQREQGMAITTEAGLAQLDRFDGVTDLVLALSGMPPQALVNFFNDPVVNGLGIDSRMMHLYRQLLLDGHHVDWSGITNDEVETLYRLITSPDIVNPYNIMRNTLHDYLRSRYRTTRIADAWTAYTDTALARAQASAATARQQRVELQQQQQRDNKVNQPVRNYKRQTWQFHEPDDTSEDVRLGPGQVALSPDQQLRMRYGAYIMKYNVGNINSVSTSRVWRLQFTTQNGTQVFTGNKDTP